MTAMKQIFTGLSSLVMVSTLVLALASCSSPAPNLDKPLANNDAYNKVVECLSDRGYKATYDEFDESIGIEAGPSQDAETVRKDLTECRTASGFDPSPEPLTEEQVQKVYEMTLDTRDCLLREGYDIPDVPTEQKFAEIYESEPFVPYAYLPALSQEDLEALELKCPQPRL